MCRSNSCDRIGGSGAGSNQGNTNGFVGPGKAVSRMDSTLFMPDKDMAQAFLFCQFIININNTTARISENRVNTFCLNHFN